MAVATFALLLASIYAMSLASAGCGPKRRDELVASPVTPDTPKERRGERLFYRYCSACHPNGEAGLGPSLNEKPLPTFAVEQQIRRGVGAMPAFPDSKLGSDQVDAIAQFVKELHQSR